MPPIVTVPPAPPVGRDGPQLPPVPPVATAPQLPPPAPPVVTAAAAASPVSRDGAAHSRCAARHAAARGRRCAAAPAPIRKPAPRPQPAPRRARLRFLRRRLSRPRRRRRPWPSPRRRSPRLSRCASRRSGSGRVRIAWGLGSMALLGAAGTVYYRVRTTTAGAAGSDGTDRDVRRALGSGDAADRSRPRRCRAAPVCACSRGSRPSPPRSRPMTSWPTAHDMGGTR